MATMLSFEFAFIAFLIGSWTYFIAATASSFLFYLLIRKILAVDEASSGEKGSLSKIHRWATGALGWVCGLAYGLFWLYLGLSYSDFWARAI